MQHADLSKNGTRFTTVATLQLAYGWPVVWVSGFEPVKSCAVMTHTEMRMPSAAVQALV
jgi:hypothetical protein